MNKLSTIINFNQVRRPLASYLPIFLLLTLNLACGDSDAVISNNPTPSCDNGQQDGDEEGVDCGGSCELLCPCENSCTLGTACSEDNACVSMNCVEGVCACPEGQIGQDGECVDREINMESCSDEPCDENASCTDGNDSFSCTCNEGFEGDGMSCSDVDECTTNPCGDDATCNNVDGSFNCSCNEGFEGDGVSCTDVDECSTNPCGDNATCTNAEGSFNCACNEGFDGDGMICTDVDECTTNPCGDDATCNNVDGSFSCTCNEGFEGDGTTCTDVDECSTNPCGENATCSNTNGSYECSCVDGYTGDGQTCTIAADCADILSNNPQATSGIYTAAPLGEAQQVWCDMSSEGAWTLWNSLAAGMLESNTNMPRCGQSRETDCYAGTYVARGYRAGIYYIESDGTTVQQLNDDLSWTQRSGAREDRGACSLIFYCASGNDICLFSYLVDEESCCTNPNMSNFCLE